MFNHLALRYFLIAIVGNVYISTDAFAQSCDSDVTEDVTTFYNSLHTYKDNGRVISPSGLEYSFMTLFRDNRLEFTYKYPEFVGPYDSLRLVADSDGARSYYEQNGEIVKEKTRKSAYQMLFTASGVTHGTSLEGPRLLLGINNIFSHGPEPTLVEVKRTQEGDFFCVVEFVTVSNREVTYWIDNNGAIRKYVSRRSAGEKEETRVTYEEVQFTTK